MIWWAWSLFGYVVGIHVLMLLGTFLDRLSFVFSALGGEKLREDDNIKNLSIYLGKSLLWPIFIAKHLFFQRP